MSDAVWWPEFEAWLHEHGIDTNECLAVVVRWTPRSVHSDGHDGPVCMEVTYCALDEQGNRFMPGGELVTRTVVVPMRHLPAVEVVRYRPDDVRPR